MLASVPGKCRGTDASSGNLLSVHHASISLFWYVVAYPLPSYVETGELTQNLLGNVENRIAHPEWSI